MVQGGILIFLSVCFAIYKTVRREERNLVKIHKIKPITTYHKMHTCNDQGEISKLAPGTSAIVQEIPAIMLVISAAILLMYTATNGDTKLAKTPTMASATPKLAAGINNKFAYIPAGVKRPNAYADIGVPAPHAANAITATDNHRLEMNRAVNRPHNTKPSITANDSNAPVSYIFIGSMAKTTRNVCDHDTNESGRRQHIGAI